MDTSFLAAHPAWFVFICVALFLTLVLMLLYAYGLRYPMTAGEREKFMYGDDYFKKDEKKIVLNAAVTINAPADLVWKYVKQTDQQKAGWYSYDWLERLATFDIWNCYLLKPSWQKLKVGDFMWMRQTGKPFVMGNWVKSINEEERCVEFVSDTRVHPTDLNAAAAMKLFAKMLAWNYSWEVAELDEYHSRLRVRLTYTWEPYTALFIPVGQGMFIMDSIMTVGYMNTLRKLCNGTLYLSNKYLSNKFVLPEEEVMPISGKHIG